ncbi:hypothetical protein HBI56_223800 [Parastagonospora nodorum]|uniref:Uncharacterized protein n=1 Tax=Phaeosphaeria nodorum (strain SN15 / ATCC MYA-4574 / FGSC 10173) TaxID=321614 RepID=A0A7U2EVS7_PHANO|nr:hypothetical protein HBH56_147190 [Parastagonospora nodorum]QRC94013.1 hypothetical protein JI435_305180 [Parastagonospora nodorum SN15]KAH3923317.1 hypothetical protein HBH54_211830 [Parastagonospora nodorum]KAH3945970.1 hypothetical protein HBH53_134650 [Parastagonospora nodorum]KAH3983843.1 hypothetical protein HBH52_065390 [Parastagonospora nodorum]
MRRGFSFAGDGMSAIDTQRAFEWMDQFYSATCFFLMRVMDVGELVLRSRSKWCRGNIFWPGLYRWVTAFLMPASMLTHATASFKVYLSCLVPRCKPQMERLANRYHTDSKIK